MEAFSHVPPGFRFHPTDEELVDYYLRKKVESRRIDLDIIKDVDLYKIEPWDLQEKCKIGVEEQNDWYFFSHKDKKYPTGTRTNRATTAGFWKATGRDKPIYTNNNLIGMRKTLVFYRGRAPNGLKSDWIMHEYRLETNENAPPQEEGWVVCRVFKKKIAAMRIENEHYSSFWYNDYMSLPNFDSTNQHDSHLEMEYHQHHQLFNCKPEVEMHHQLPHDSFLQLPQLESHVYINQASPLQPSNIDEQMHSNKHLQLISTYATDITRDTKEAGENITDWRALDKFVASQLCHDEIYKECIFSNLSADVQTSKKCDGTTKSTSTSNLIEL
ncbi:NAC domain-containing protein 7-like [Zingiber officinale]|uniref:NAC domain-containing protein n=1 Tax=Zingiber officinale TaxID=94328 RepID=A0A8J5FV41_ZINOF|nr:NAC domain-containing protein 7-like [Zingiber officinale]KAG6495525.1 hypothetical protein ZIOFF_043350 [Zingiber officinale]